MSELIDANELHEIFLDCLAGEEDERIEENLVIVEGIVHTFGLDRTKVEKHRDEVLGMLLNLPPEFRMSVGKGWSFLQVPFDKDGNQWGEHSNAEQLMVLGMALGLVDLLAPRSMWSALPGGVPYYAVKDEG